MTHCDKEATWSSSSLERLVSSIVSQSGRVYGSGNNRRGTQMRKHLLMSTVALLAGLAVASAQHVPGGDGQRSGAAQKQERGEAQSRQSEQGKQGKSSESKS